MKKDLRNQDTRLAAGEEQEMFDEELEEQLAEEKETAEKHKKDGLP